MSQIRVWTDAQRKAFEASSRSVVVSAAAGSGKTSVLIEKYSKLLLAGNSPERILVITFTRKAAAQLRERAMKALLKSGDPKLATLIPAVAQAPISTIHSFCSSLVREYAPVAEIDPSFGTLEETEATELLIQAYERAVNLHSRDEKHAADFEQLLRIFGTGRADESLRLLVFMLHEFLRRLPDPDDRKHQWLSMYEETVGASDFAETIWGRLYLETLEAELAVWKREFRGLAAEFMQIAAPLKWREVFGHDFEIIASVFNAFPDLDAMAEKCDIKWEKSPNKTKDDARANRWKERFTQFRKGFRDKFSPQWLIPSATLLSDLRRFHEGGALANLIKLSDEVSAAYARMKRLMRVLDYADLIVTAYRLIVDAKQAGTEVCAALTSRFSHILMDEYQDTNPIQDAIVDMLAELPNVQVFRVGDIKQSIYRFQHAEPDLIRNRYNRSTDSMDAEERRIDLPDNFRSVSPVVDFVNAGFARLMTDDFGCVNYNEGHALTCRYGTKHEEPAFTDDFPSVSLKLVVQGASTPSGDDESPIETKDADESYNENESAGEAQAESGDADGGDKDQLDPVELKRREREVALVAREILRMMNADPPLTVLDDTRMGKARVRLSYRHIAILLSAPSSWVETYGRIFGVLGIPIRGTGKDALDDEPIARDLLNLLAIIDNPIQDIPLAGALLSPMCGASPDTLFLMRVSIHKDAQLYDTMQNALLLGWDEFVASFKDMLKDEALLDRIKSDFGLLKDFASKLDKLRSFARSHSVAELVEHAIVATSLDDIATLDTRSNGALSRLNYIRARARDAGGIELSRFLTMLTGGERIELPVGAVGESIELMSVHQAKGLEFPVVILGGLGHNFNLEDIRKNVLFDRELGFGTKVIHPKNPVRYPTAAFSVVKRRMQTRQLEEEMRKLYVATTRAQERLILVGTTRGAAIAGKYEEKRGDGAQPVLERENARCFADWIVPLALESQAFHDALSSCGVFPKTAPRGFGAHFGAECTSEVEIDEYFAEKTAKSSVIPGSEYEKIAKDEPAPYAECADTANDGSGSVDAPSRAPALEIPEVVVHSYAYRDATIARAKVSATALAHMDDPDSLSVRFKRSEPYFHLPEKPLTLAERKLGVDADLDDTTPAIKRGIALHLLMERLPFGIGVKIDVICEIGKLKDSGVLTDELAGMIPGDSVVRILDTPIGRRLCGKGSVKTEWRFLSRVGVDKLKESPRVLRALGIIRENTGSDFDAQNDKLAIRASDGDFIVLQGVVDLIFEDGAGRIVVDWKTNNVAESEVPACAESYALQLWAYRYAVETAIGAVDDAYLAFVMPGVYTKARL